MKDSFDWNRSLVLRSVGQTGELSSGVSVSLATEEASITAAYRLYLPETWANDKELRKQAGVPKEISFQTKPDIVRPDPFVGERRCAAWCGAG